MPNYSFKLYSYDNNLSNVEKKNVTSNINTKNYKSYINYRSMFFKSDKKGCSVCGGKKL